MARLARACLLARPVPAPAITAATASGRCSASSRSARRRSAVEAQIFDGVDAARCLEARRGFSATSAALLVRTRPGEVQHGWTCERVEQLDELKCSGVLWRHNQTGAELLSVEQPTDENKTFGVIFRTPPEDSTGVAHVIEHSVLCGSRKYPVKEPFTELLKGSMNTFLNAMTYPDRTCYPVASCNLQDFYNLVDVYLDAVFHPRMMKDPRILAQEGWHYEVDGEGEALTYKGVVFNEMKGVYSNPDSVQGRTLLNNLLPDTTYRVDSGGSPQEIPNLTFDGMQSFFKRYYHPSNAKFWFYGDDPVDRRLELLDEYLREFQRQAPSSDIARQPLWQQPRRVEHEFAVGKDEDVSKKHMACVSWVLAEDQLDPEAGFALSVLDYCLMGSPSAPLRKALTDSGLGSRVIGGGLYDGLAQPTFSVGLKDVSAANTSAVESLVLQTLEKIASDGFEHEAVEAALNRIEFMSRELNSGGFPRGLSLMLSAVSGWNYDKDPFERLRFDGPLNALRAKLVERREPLLEGLIVERLLRNNHRLTVVSRPSLEEGDRIDAEEKRRLEECRSKLRDAEISGLIRTAKELKEMQETPDSPEALALVPRLEISDIPKASRKIPTDIGRIGAAVVLRHPLLTSGVVYVDVAFDLSGVPERLLPLLPLFCRALREMGTTSSDFVKLQRRVDLSTGGISASPIISSKRGSSEPVAYLVMRGKAMRSKVGDLFGLMSEIATDVTWGNDTRFVQLAKEAQAAGRSALLSSGHSIAAGRLVRQQSTAGWAAEQLSGLSQFQAVGDLLELAARNWPLVEAQLRELQAHIFRSACVVNLTADAEALAALDPHVDAFLGRLPAQALSPLPWEPSLVRVNEGLIVPSQVNYVAKSANLYNEADWRLHGSAVVASRLLGTSWLWDRIRVVGGAYGCFCKLDIRSGSFSFLSYRDPNLEQSLEVYDGSAAFMRELAVNADLLAKSVIGTMGDVDQHQLPDAKGFTALNWHILGETDEMRQELRDQILNTTGDDLRNFADALEVVRRSGTVCVVGGGAQLQAAAGRLGLELSSPLAAATPAAGA